MEAQIWKCWVTDDFIHDPNGYLIIKVFIPSVGITITNNRIYNDTQDKYIWTHDRHIPNIPPKLLKTIILSDELTSHVQHAVNYINNHEVALLDWFTRSFRKT